MGKIKTEELKNKYFYEMGIKKFRRFRQIWVKIFGFWFFKDSDPILAKNQVKKIDTEIHCQKDIDEYMARLMEKEMNTNKPLWEIHVAENYEDDTSIVFILIHHMLSDGMGIISLITFLNDNQSTESIQHFRDLSFVHKYVFPIVYIPLGIIKYAMSGILCKGDPNMTPFVLKDGIPSMEKKYLETKNYNFPDLKCCYSKFEGVKLNNYLMSCISVSLSKYFNELGISTDKQTHYTISVPYNMKPQPKCIDDVQFLNYNSHILVNLPLNSNFEYVVNEYKRRVNPNITFLRFVTFVVAIIGSFPPALIRVLMKDNCLGLNLLVSNIAGSQTPMFFCDKEVYDISCIGPNLGGSGITIIIFSYCSKVKLQILTDSGISFDSTRFLQILEDFIDEGIAKNCK